MRSFKIPRHFNPSHVDEFLETFGEIFTARYTHDEAIYLAQRNTKISILGATALYKVINYASLNKCFKRWHVDCDQSFKSQLTLYGLQSWIDMAMNGSDSAVEQLPVRLLKMQGNFVITPQALTRRNLDRESFKKGLILTLKYYYNNQELTDMIYGCLSEILSNFWEHATDDPKSILIVECSKTNISIACTDTGNGIVRTLKDSNLKYVKYKPFEVLREAVKRSVTSKPSSNHLGLGLWILDRMATESSGLLHIYSQGGSYKNDAGKTYGGDCGYWDGTMVYLNLRLDKVISIHQILEQEGDLMEQNLQLNFV